MSLINMMAGAHVSAGLNFEYQGTTVNTANKSGADNYTFISHAIGEEHPDRMVVVVVALQAGLTVLSSIQFNGVSGTLVRQGNASGISAIGYKKISTGTTATIKVNLSSGSMSNCSVSVYSFNTKATSALDFGYGNSGAQPLSNIQIVNGGVLIGGCIGNPTTVTWTGADALVNDYNTTVETYRHHAVSALTTEDTTTDDINFGSIIQSTVVSFGPE